MEKIRFLNDYNVYDGKVSAKGNVIALKFTDTLPPKNIMTNGFELLNENNGIVQGNYGGYITIYRTYENDNTFIELSNDGSIYTPPVIPDPVPEPAPYVLTYEEVLNEKIMELSYVCQCMIEDGLEINGLHYSYTEKDQINLNDIINTVKLTGLPLGYHANGQDCTEYTAEELMNIYIQLAMNKYCQQTYFNQARSYLKSLKESDSNKEVIKSYAYGTPLIGIYLDNYNTMVALYNAQIQAIMAQNE